MKNKSNLVIKIIFIVLFIISIYFIISGLTDKEEVVIYEEGISLSEVSIDLEVNETKKIEASVIPPNATYKGLTWTSTIPSIATVDNGLITAISPGTSMIKVETEKMKIARVITVNVHPKVIAVERIIIENPNIELYEGETSSINYQVEPSDATNKNLTFKSENPNIAAFNDKYEIVGVSEGETIITLSSDNGITEKVNVKVKKKIIDVTKVELNKQGLVLKVGESQKLSAKVSPSNATNKDVTWESSNTSVANVNDGLVQAVGYGDATITAKSNNGMVATCQIVVAKEFDSRNNAVKAYFSDSSRNIRSNFNNYKCGKTKDCDRPVFYNSSITGDIKVYLYNASTNKKEHIKTVKDSVVLTNIMVPGNTYYLESSDGNSHEYVTISKVVRMIYVKDTHNVRDIGGWKADGGTIRYGIIFRGAEPYASPSTTEAMFKNIGVTDIVDLRSKSQWNGDKNKFKSFGKHDYPAYAYSINNKSNRAATDAIMKLVVAGKHIYFHCAVGTDRTGSIAMLLEGILGVSESNLFDEFELSYYRRQVYNVGKTRTNSSIVKFYNGTAKDGNNTQEKFINWFLSGSSNKENDLKLINNFRKTMIDGNPTVYKLSNGQLVKE